MRPQIINAHEYRISFAPGVDSNEGLNVQEPVVENTSPRRHKSQAYAFRVRAFPAILWRVSPCQKIIKTHFPRKALLSL